MPVDEKEHSQMLEYINDKIAAEADSDKFKLIIAQDSNAQVGIRDRRHDIDFFNAVGPFGCETTNSKGQELVDFCEQHSLFITNTYFQKPCYSTWKSFSGQTMHQIDHIIADKTLKCNVTDSAITTNGTISDHTALKLTLSIYYPKRITNRKFKCIDWDIFTQDAVKLEYNDTFGKMCETNAPTSLEMLSELMLGAAKQVASREKNDDAGWYQENKSFLKPLLDERNNILFAARKAVDDVDYWRRRCRDAKKNWNNGVCAAIAQWAHKIASEVHDMPANPKRAWEAIKTLKKGLESHHKQPQTMKFKREDGTFSKNDCEHSDLLEPHFFKVFNRNPAIDKNIFEKVMK